MIAPDEVRDIMNSDHTEQKIKILEMTCECKDITILNTVILALDDNDIRVRGEAFSALVQNENDISVILMQSLKNQNKNVRGFSALILANRNDRKAIPKIMDLASDDSAMVRSCAIGALGYLKAKEAIHIIQKGMEDSIPEVKKSAIKAAIDIGDKTAFKRLDEISTRDPEFRSLLVYAKNKLGGPGGI